MKRKGNDKGKKRPKRTRNLEDGGDVCTYCEGYDLEPIKNITKDDIVKLCESLQNKFNSTVAGNEKYIFEPECITEGGIVMKSWPGKKEEQYKTMRIWFSKAPGGSWPFVDNPMELWHDDMLPILNIETYNREYLGTSFSSRKPKRSKKEPIHTFLKAFRGAPLWTTKELIIFEHCLDSIGLIRASKYPPKRQLSSPSGWYA
jgi:hypothetical protein